jgi:hypothetical protein
LFGICCLFYPRIFKIVTHTHTHTHTHTGSFRIAKVTLHKTYKGQVALWKH